MGLIGATSAYIYFFQACRSKKMSFCLPPVSRVCDGGGYRNRFGVFTRDDYYAMVQEVLGVSETHCVNVLGEAETATNLFDDALRRHVKGLPPRRRTRPVPPWCRVLSMSIDDLKPLPDGEVGLLAHWDLANVPTVLAVITDNLGYTTDNGRGCEMVGRAKIENGKVSPLPDDEDVMVVQKIPLLDMAKGIGNKKSLIKTYWWSGFSMEESVLVNDVPGTLFDYALAGDKMVVLASPFLGIKFENVLKGENPLGTSYVHLLCKGKIAIGPARKDSPPCGHYHGWQWQMG